MPCCNKGKSKSSLQSEREREARNIARREIARQNPEATKAILDKRRGREQRRDSER